MHILACDIMSGHCIFPSPFNLCCAFIFFISSTRPNSHAAAIFNIYSYIFCPAVLLAIGCWLHLREGAREQQPCRPLSLCPAVLFFPFLPGFSLPRFAHYFSQIDRCRPFFLPLPSSFLHLLSLSLFLPRAELRMPNEGLVSEPLAWTTEAEAERTQLND